MDQTINISDFPDNDGAIVEVAGKKFAVFKNAGDLKVFSPRCTHKQCDIEWQKDDKIWKCPCHGARFQPTGEVIQGPAERPLDQSKFPENINTLTIKESAKRSLDDFEF